MERDEMRDRVRAARVARLATTGQDGRAHLVPCVFALDDNDVLHLVVDRKPKRTTALMRLENLRRDPRATVLVDHYDEDWDALWWVRMDGTARIQTEHVEPTLALLRAKYPQYEATAMEEIAILFEVTGWRGWRALAGRVR